MSAIGSGDTTSGRIRARLDHPVIDADGHLIETAPVFKNFLVDYAKQIGGGDIAARFEKAGGIDYDETVLRPWSALSDEQRRALWTTRPPWWTFPASNTLDRATGQLPRLMYERLDDFGIDFAVLYPSRTLTTTAIRDDEVRQVACRALNAFNSDVYGEYRDRMTTVAHIPMHTPGEALAELDHAVGELGFKAILINGLVHRPVGSPADEKPGMGGVTRRFPGLSFALLEGGVGWACILFADIVSHWEKRNATSIHDLDPARIDIELLMKLFAEYGDARFTADLDRVKESVTRLEPEPPYTDEWAACRIDRIEDLHDLFVPRFYFGCEADDPTVAWAFDTRANPLGAKLRAMFSSDMGHWDVPEMSGVLAEAHELVEKGLIDEAAFRDFVFVNPARFYTSANPDFFVGTRCEQAAAKLLAASGGGD
jgi:hypothetical protein